jgi:hypothetical protein
MKILVCGGRFDHEKVFAHNKIIRQKSSIAMTTLRLIHAGSVELSTTLNRLPAICAPLLPIPLYLQNRALLGSESLAALLGLKFLQSFLL